MAEEMNYPSLQGKRVSTTYGGVLHLPHSLTGTKNIVFDGKGNASSLTLGNSGMGIDVTGSATFTGSSTVSGNSTVLGNISAVGNVILQGGGNINDIIVGSLSAATTLIVPNKTEVGKLRIRETNDDYELVFGNASVADSNLFTILVKKSGSNNLYIKNTYSDSDNLSPLWIDRATGEVNIKSLKVTNIQSTPAPNTPIPPNRPANRNTNIIPVGMIGMFPFLSVPEGWFMCDGSLKEVVTFPELFALLGYSYGGIGDYFGLPDYRELFLRGHGGGRGIDSNQNRVPGNREAASSNTHWHGVGNGHSNDDGTFVGRNWSMSLSGMSTFSHLINGESNGNSPNSQPALSSGTLGTTNNIDIGSGDNRPENIAVVYCIKW